MPRPAGCWRSLASRSRRPIAHAVSEPAPRKGQESATDPEEAAPANRVPAKCSVFVNGDRPIAALRDPDCHRWYPVPRWWARRRNVLPVAAGNCWSADNVFAVAGVNDDEVHDVRLAGIGIHDCTLRFPARATSVLLTGAAQELAVSQVVTRAVRQFAARARARL